MDQNAIATLVSLIRSTGFANVTCQRNFDPPVVEIDLVGGIGITIPYDTYEQIRQDAGLPEGVCNTDNTNG